MAQLLTTNDDKQNDDFLINVKQLRQKVPVSEMSVWRMVKDGRLPKPRLIGNRRYWYASEVKTALAKLMEV